MKKIERKSFEHAGFLRIRPNGPKPVSARAAYIKRQTDSPARLARVTKPATKLKNPKQQVLFGD